MYVFEAVISSSTGLCVSAVFVLSSAHCTRTTHLLLSSGLYDTCIRHHNVPRFYWRIGIATSDVTATNPQNAYLHFSVRSHRSYRVSVLSDAVKYRPNQWVHVAATYDGVVTRFFVNGAKVAESRATWGLLFERQNAAQCLSLRLGGDRHTDDVFRGELKSLALYAGSLHQSQLLRHMQQVFSPDVDRLRDSSALLHENFDDLQAWKTLTNDSPILRRTNFRQNVLRHDVGLNVPPCGITVCDDPQVVKSYAANHQLRQRKTLRYRIINIAKDDGTEPLISSEQIRSQHDVLQTVFSRYNISLQLSEVTIHNASLRNHKIFYGCEASRVGDGFCDAECEHELTGNDGGDCDDTPPFCLNASIGNGVCDEECNRRVYEFDGGDCCQGPTAYMTCFDPVSPNRCCDRFFVQNCVYCGCSGSVSFDLFFFIFFYA